MICAHRKRLKVSICDNFKNRALNLSSQSHFFYFPEPSGVISVRRPAVSQRRSAVSTHRMAVSTSRFEISLRQGVSVSLQGYSCFPARVQLFPCKGTLTNRRPETPDRRAETPLRQEEGAVSRKGTKKGRRVGVFLESFYTVCPFRGDRSGAVIPFREYVGCVRQGSP